jgi:hypothetical protein
MTVIHVQVGCDGATGKIAYPTRDVTYMKFKKDDRSMVAFYVEGKFYF